MLCWPSLPQAAISTGISLRGLPLPACMAAQLRVSPGEGLSHATVVVQFVTEWQGKGMSHATVMVQYITEWQDEGSNEDCRALVQEPLLNCTGALAHRLTYPCRPEPDSFSCQHRQVGPG